jgi:hypothetical protein
MRSLEEAKRRKHENERLSREREKKNHKTNKQKLWTFLGRARRQEHFLVKKKTKTKTKKTKKTKNTDGGTGGCTTFTTGRR